MSDKYRILSEYNDYHDEYETWDKEKVAESLGDDLYLEESDFYWANVNDRFDHKIVVWKKNDGESVRKIDVFRPLPEERMDILIYEKGVQDGVFNPHRVVDWTIEEGVLSLEACERLLVDLQSSAVQFTNTYNDWHEEIEGDLISQFEEVDDDTEESDYRYEQSRDDRDYEERLRRKNNE